MNQFQIIRPSNLLAPFVKEYWFIQTKSLSETLRRFSPVGSMGLGFHRGDQVYSISEDKFQPQVHISGQYTNHIDLKWKGSLNLITVVFQPTGAQHFFRTPLNELENRQIAIEDVHEPVLMELSKRLNLLADNAACVKVIEAYLLKRIQLIDSYNQNRINTVIHAIHSGMYDTSNLAATACLGYKQFKRVFTESVGLNPKAYMRIIRFNKALRRFQTLPQISLTKLAEQCGYFDKSHLIREIKLFSGYTPGEYLEIQSIELSRQDFKPYRPDSEEFTLFRSAFTDQ